MRLREELLQQQHNPSRTPTARRDTTRLSVQDVPTRLTSSAQRFFVPFLGSRPTKPQISSPRASGVCEVWSRTCPRLAARNLIDGQCSFARKDPSSKIILTAGRHAPRKQLRCAACVLQPHIPIILTSRILCPLSQFCRLKPRYGKDPYCSKTCAVKAGGVV